MKRTIALITLATLGASAAAIGQTLEITESAHELTLSNVILPASAAGNLIYRDCPDCDAVSAPVRLTTRYISPAGDMPLADFRDYVIDLNASAANNAEIYVTVFRNTEDGSVKRVKVHGTD